MKVFDLSVGAVIARFYLMMLIVIAAGFIGQWWLAFFALPVFLSIMFGLKLGNYKEQKKEANIKPLESSNKEARKAG